MSIRYLHFVAESDGQVLAALSRLWEKIRAEHGGVPSVVIDITPGRGSSCTSVGWLEIPIIEINLKDNAGEKLQARQVLELMLHQAAHSQTGPATFATEGRFHPEAYRQAAERLGLTVERKTSAGTGWSMTSLARGTLSRYQPEIRALDSALKRWVPTDQVKATRSSRNLVAARCSCSPPRKIRLSEKTLDAANITCGYCGGEFRRAS